MGTDIHMYAEVLQDDGTWDSAGDYFDNPRHDPEKYKNADNEFDRMWYGPKTEHPFDNRSYNLFAILADVRNGFGFAGIKTGEGFNTITGSKHKRLEGKDPLYVGQEYNPETRPVRRGIPADSPHRHVMEDACYHSLHWLRLDEILKFNWDQTTKQTGTVDPIQYMEFKKNGEPSAWCGMRGDGRKGYISNTEMEEWIEENGIPEGEALFSQNTPVTRVEWEHTYRDAVCGTWWSQAIPQLQKLAKEAGGPENVRVVMGFDS